MPIPKPDSGETEKDFIPRCIRAIIDEYDRDQALGICYSQLKREEMSKKKEYYIIQPRKTENRGTYLSRCSNNSKMKSQFPNMKERMGFCLNTFNEYYSYWSKLEDFAEKDTKGTALGDCIAKEKAKGFDYKEAYAHCASRVVVQPQGGTNPQVLEQDLLIEPVEFNEMNILGYNTKYFYICPGAQATFQHLMEMNVNDDVKRMIRNAAMIADKVFEIEAEVMSEGEADLMDLEQAKLMVQDFYDLMKVIDTESKMKHDVSYMDGHIEKIKSLLEEEMGLEDACWEGYEAIGTKIVNGREVPNCVPIKEDK